MNDYVCDNLDAYLDDALAPGESARFASHLDDCPTCREAVDQQRWIDGLLRSPTITQLEPPPALVESCRTSLARREKQLRFIACGLAAAAAMILIAVGWTQLNRQASGPAGHNVATISVEPTTTEETTPQPAVFVGDANLIVVPVASPSPNVTVVRVYPVYQPDYMAEADTGSAAELQPLDDSIWTDSFNGG